MNNIMLGNVGECLRSGSSDSSKRRAKIYYCLLVDSRHLNTCKRMFGRRGGYPRVMCSNEGSTQGCCCRSPANSMTQEGAWLPKRIATRDGTAQMGFFPRDSETDPNLASQRPLKLKALKPKILSL